MTDNKEWNLDDLINHDTPPTPLPTQAQWVAKHRQPFTLKRRLRYYRAWCRYLWQITAWHIYRLTTRSGNTPT